MKDRPLDIHRRIIEKCLTRASVISYSLPLPLREKNETLSSVRVSPSASFLQQVVVSAFIVHLHSSRHCAAI